MHDTERATCDDVMAELTARMADGALDPGYRGALPGPVAEHLERCPTCQEEAAELEEVWGGLAALPDPQPPTEELRERVDRMISAYRAGLEATGERPTPQTPRAGVHPALRWAAALAATFAAAAIGLAVGWVAASGRSGDEMATLRTEVRSLHQMMALSLLDGASASERLRGVSFGASMPQPGTPVTAALLQAASQDPSVNVRLAAVDALAPGASDPTVRRALIDALAGERSPLVQVAIADLLLDTDGAEARRAVSELLDRTTLHPAVRGHLGERLGQRI